MQSSSATSTTGAKAVTESAETRQSALLKEAFDKEVYADARSLLTNFRNLLDLHANLANARSLGRHQDLQVSTAATNIALHANHLLELIHELKVQALVLSSQGEVDNHIHS